MEFMFKKGIGLEAEKNVLQKILDTMDGLTRKDYDVKLGSLLQEDQRKYYREKNFSILRAAIQERIG